MQIFLSLKINWH